jgi:hypothetical protein
MPAMNNKKKSWRESKCELVFNYSVHSLPIVANFDDFVVEATKVSF